MFKLVTENLSNENDLLTLSLDEIATRFSLTRERVRQIKEKALKKMKNSSRNKLLRTYLGA